jgi:hypothetical protein
MLLPCVSSFDLPAREFSTQAPAACARDSGKSSVTTVASIAVTVRVSGSPAP